MNGSNGNIVALLERIANANERTNERLEALERGQQQLREDMNQGFDKVDARFDHVLKFMGARNSDHEERIRALEEQVFKKSS